MELRGRVAIVTGASSGIGAATARALAREGATVVLAARREDRVRRVAARIERMGGHAMAVPTDVTRREDIDRLVERVVADYGRIDILVNNAGIGGGGALDDSDELMARMVATNLLAPARLVQAVVPHMRRAGGGVVVNIGSVAGDIGTMGMYAGTKFGLRGLSDAWRREFGPDGIAVVLIAPGFIRTGFTRGMPLPLPGPDPVARAVVSAIRRPRRRITVPRLYALPITIEHLFPRLVDSVLHRAAVWRRRQKSRQGLTE